MSAQDKLVQAVTEEAAPVISKMNQELADAINKLEAEGKLTGLAKEAADAVRGGIGRGAENTVNVRPEAAEALVDSIKQSGNPVEAKTAESFMMRGAVDPDEVDAIHQARFDQESLAGAMKSKPSDTPLKAEDKTWGFYGDRLDLGIPDGQAEYVFGNAPWAPRDLAGGMAQVGKKAAIGTAVVAPAVAGEPAPAQAKTEDAAAAPTAPDAPADTKKPADAAVKSEEGGAADGQSVKPATKTIDDYIKEYSEGGPKAVSGQRFVASTKGIDDAIQQQRGILDDSSIRDKITDKDKAEFRRDLNRFEAILQDGRESIGYAQAAEIIGGALVQLGAAMYGLKKGVDTSGYKFTPSDWNARRKEIADDARRAYEVRVEEYKMLEREAERGAARKSKAGERITELQVTKDKEINEADAATKRSKQAADAANAQMKFNILEAAIRAKNKDADLELKALELKVDEAKAKGTSDKAAEATMERLQKEKASRASGLAKYQQAIAMDQETKEAQRLISEGSEALAAGGVENPYSIYEKALEEADKPRFGRDVKAGVAAISLPQAGGSSVSTPSGQAGKRKYTLTDPDTKKTGTYELTEDQLKNIKPNVIVTPVGE